MNRLDEIAKMAIDEVSAELNSIDLMQKPAYEIRQSDEKKEPEAPTNQENVGSEEIFLNNLNERIEVLFEGLNQTPKQNLEHRLDLTLRFLEFALANIQNRLDNLKK